MRKICVVTGTRAEYGLLNRLIKLINDSDKCDLQLIVTAMHLSPEFGLTYREIENDGFQISKKIETLVSSDTPIGVSKSIGLGVISFSEAYDELNPDIIVLLGDRTEILSASISALISGIPIAHIHGGELTEGAYDDAIRHSVTKMSNIHFTSTEEYRKRVIQLGEQPHNVYNVGALGIDNISNMKLLSKNELEESLSIKLDKRIVMVTYHPETLGTMPVETQLNNLFNSLDTLEDTTIIITKPNSDKEGRSIIKMIDDYSSSRSNVYSYISLGYKRYLSVLQYIDCVIGNSSSGILEVPLFNIPTVNIGDRQLGRVMPESVISCGNVEQEITNAINLSLKDNFKESCIHSINPYMKKGTAKEIFKVVSNKKIDNIIKKRFYNYGS